MATLEPKPHLEAERVLWPWDSGPVVLGKRITGAEVGSHQRKSGHHQQSTGSRAGGEPGTGWHGPSSSQWPQPPAPPQPPPEPEAALPRWERAGALTQSPWTPSPATMLPPKCLSGLPPAPLPARPGGASPPPSEPSNSLLRAVPAFHALLLTSTRILLKCNSPHSVNQRLILKTFGLKARLLSGALQGLFLPENFFSVPQCVSFLLPSPLISHSVSASHHFLWAAFCGPGVRKGLLV